MAKHKHKDDDPETLTEPYSDPDIATQDTSRQPDGETCHCDALAVPHVHTPTGVEYAKD